ncbi:MAG: DNA recombination protein RmuC [Candidatus Andersenbacteria bacterium]
MTLEFLWLFAGIGVGGGLLWIVLKKRPTGPAPDTFLQLQHDIASRLDRVTDQLDRRLRENVVAMNESKSFLASRVDTAERTVREVSTSLGKLGHATEALQRTNEEITAWQQMLKSPKVRGSFGEVLLGNLLADVLPADRYELQYMFPSSGEIGDAIIKLQDGYIVAIDAKFPLANYQLYIDEQEQARRQTARKLFIRDIKKHISDIGHKYISPQERTLDYAFMYVPLEGVYYETMVHDQEGESLWQFCLQQKVIPVSPNSFLAYLQTILVGLRGMKVEQQTKEILQTLQQVRRDFQQFVEDFGMVGKHLNNAKNRFDDSARRLDKFSNRLEQIETTTPRIEATVEEEEPVRVPE